MEFYICSDFLYDLFSDGDANIVLYTGKDSEIIIPHSLDGHRVTTVGGFAFSGMDFIESISIPDSVDEICVAAFERCSALRRVFIPPSVTEIDPSAFFGCPAVEIIVNSGSAACIFAEKHRIKYRISEE